MVQTEFERLKANQKSLTAAERAEVMKAKATWHHGRGGAASPAVWKSVDSKGKVTYVTASHRAYDTATTLKGAIRRFHDFIKGTG